MKGETAMKLAVNVAMYKHGLLFDDRASSIVEHHTTCSLPIHLLSRGYLIPKHEIDGYESTQQILVQKYYSLFRSR